MELHVLTGSTLLALTLGAQQLLAPVATAAGGGTTATDGTDLHGHTLGRDEGRSTGPDEVATRRVGALTSSVS